MSGNDGAVQMPRTEAENRLDKFNELGNRLIEVCERKPLLFFGKAKEQYLEQRSQLVIDLANLVMS